MDRLITIDDVVRAGACHDGAYTVAARLGGKLAAAMSVSAVIALLRTDEQQYAIAAGELDGDGSGYGYGYGSGSGYGDGYGDGYGYVSCDEDVS